MTDHEPWDVYARKIAGDEAEEPSITGAEPSTRQRWLAVFAATFTLIVTLALSSTIGGFGLILIHTVVAEYFPGLGPVLGFWDALRLALGLVIVTATLRRASS